MKIRSCCKKKKKTHAITNISDVQYVDKSTIVVCLSDGIWNMSLEWIDTIIKMQAVHIIDLVVADLSRGTSLCLVVIGLNTWI